MNEEVKISNNKPVKLWNKNFFLLWQGQLVSALGDILYMIALDFWILDITGSTAIMGLLSAVTMLPRMVVGPFAGVFVDKWKRRNVIVITDLIRGIVVTFVGVAGIFGFIQVWMVFLAGAISGLCSAFFGPAVSAIKPELVPESKLVKANSLTSMADSGMQIAGNAIGGIIYVAIGAPYMFFLNGISYLLSAFSEIFIKEPVTERELKTNTFKEDFMEGLKFVWNFKTLRNILLIASILNLIGASASILILPYFKATEFLGPEKYGLFMAVMPIAMLCGSSLLAVINIKKKYKFVVYAASEVISQLAMLTIFLVSNYYIMVVLAFVFQFFNVIFNTMFFTVMSLVVPGDKRGKISALMNTLSMGMMPLGSIAGGVLGQIFSIRTAIIAMFTVNLILGIVIMFIKGSKTVITYDSEDGSIDELIEKSNNGIAM